MKVVHRAEQGGIVAASSDALAAATGTLVALVDHDDVLEPHALGAMAAVLTGGLAGVGRWCAGRLQRSRLHPR